MVSNLIVIVSTWLIFVFTLNLAVELSDSVYRSFLHKDFIHYSRVNSSRMIGVLSSEIPRYVYNVVQPFLIHFYPCTWTHQLTLHEAHTKQPLVT